MCRTNATVKSNSIYTIYTMFSQVYEKIVISKRNGLSSHATTVVALLVLSAAEIRRRWFTFLMVAATLLICYSRIYLAKHFPVDLLLGAAVGALTGWAMLRAYRCIGRIRRPPLPEKRRRRA